MCGLTLPALLLATANDVFEPIFDLAIQLLSNSAVHSTVAASKEESLVSSGRAPLVIQMLGALSGRRMVLALRLRPSPRIEIGPRQHNSEEHEGRHNSGEHKSALSCHGLTFHC